MFNYIPVIPHSVEVHTDCIEDKQTTQSFPLNATARTMLTVIDGKKNIAMIIEALNDIFPVSKEQLQTDFIQLCRSLNEKHLLNFHVTSSNKVVSVLRYYAQQYHPSFHERTDISGKNFLPIFMHLFVLLFKKLSLFWCFITLMFAGAAVIFQTPQLLLYVYYFSVLHIVVVVSFALHEALHTYLGRKIAGTPFGFIANDWLSIKFVRPASSQKMPRMWLATLLGPLIPGTIGLIGLITLVSTTSTPPIVGVFSCILFSLHLLYLNPFFGDGRTLVQQLLLRRLSL
ncbi:PqqD family protein [Bacillus sp. FSL W7-1360]